MSVSSREQAKKCYPLSENFEPCRKNNLKLILKHWDRDIFILEWPIVDDSQSKVIFIPDESGKISKMRIEYFAREGSGDFEKSP